jgi:hypothetical protein
MVIFTFTWPLVPAEELLSISSRSALLTSLRSEILRAITPSLTELVELQLRRLVSGSLPTVADDPRYAMVTFALGAPRGIDQESAEALRNWARQLRLNAGRQRRLYKERREELRRRREEMARRREEKM